MFHIIIQTHYVTFFISAHTFLLDLHPFFVVLREMWLGMWELWLGFEVRGWIYGVFFGMIIEFYDF